MATREYMLGEHLPYLHITFWVGFLILCLENLQ